MRSAAVAVLALTLAACAGQAGDAVRKPDNLLASAKVHTELAAAYYERSQLGVALDELRVALQAMPTYAPAYNVRGLVHMALREEKEADEDFQHSLQLDPND